MLPESQKASIAERVITSSTRFLKWIASQCLSDYTSVECAQNIIDIFSNEYLGCEVSHVTEKSLASLVDDISHEKHFDFYPDILMDLLDEIVLPVNHRIPPSQNFSEYKHLDWIWIREEILRFRESGIKFPALKANLMEQVGIVDISREVYASALKIDFRHQFIFITSSNGMEMALVRSWEEVIP